jgi:hypothetical protein
LDKKATETCKTCTTIVTYPKGGGSGYQDTFEACDDLLTKIPKDKKYNNTEWFTVKISYNNSVSYTKVTKTTCK